MNKIKAKKNLAKDVEKKPVPPITVPPRQQPSNKNALLFIDGCVATAPLSRSEHIQAQGALQQIDKALAELEQLKKGKSNDG